MTLQIKPILDERRGIRIRIARELGITHGAVSQWDQVPAVHVTRVSEILGIAPHVLRSDVFPAPAPAPAHATEKQG